jgi:endonuclease/exonuclease/phosphatase family metal-dependent hydrolase
MAAVNRTLRVGTWNLHEGVPADEVGSWGRLRDRPGTAANAATLQRTTTTIVQLINELDMDIVGFQEVRFDQDFAADIVAVARDTALRYVATFSLSPSSFFSGACAGVAIASKYPLTEIRKTKLPNPNLRKSASGEQISSHDKGLLSVRADVQGRQVTLASLHMLPFHIFERSADDAAFATIWRRLAFELESLSRLPLIVCGDFNTPKRDFISAPETLALRSAIDGRPTYNDAAIDDILYSSQFSAGAVKTLGNFSDHAFCVGDLELT